MLQSFLLSLLFLTFTACGASGYSSAVYDPPLQAHEQVANYHPGGVPMSKGAKRDGREEGAWIYYYASGKQMSGGDYFGGKQVGPWTYWDERGQIESRGGYRAGLREGEWWFWDAAGKVDAARSGVYRAGERVGT